MGLAVPQRRDRLPHLPWRQRLRRPLQLRRSASLPAPRHRVQVQDAALGLGLLQPVVVAAAVAVVAVVLLPQLQHRPWLGHVHPQSRPGW